MRTFLFDTETDGLIVNSAMRLEKQPRIIELFGVVLDENDNELEIWQSLFLHPAPLPKEIIEITGINDAMLIGQPLFFDKADELRTLIEGCDRVVAHNLKYDRDMVNNEMLRISRFVKWPDEMICTVEATEFLKGFRLGLNVLHEHLFGERFKDAHRAEPDVRALVRCYIECRKRGWV
jgi:DNA polymerase III epsilon subunit-like protein